MKWILLLALLQCSCVTQPKPTPSAAAHNESAFEVIPLKYAPADEVARQLSNLGLSASANDAEPCKFVADARTNSLLVQADPAALARIRTAVERIDVQAK